VRKDDALVIYRSAWKGNSVNFALTGFYEVSFPLATKIHRRFIASPYEKGRAGSQSLSGLFPGGLSFPFVGLRPRLCREWRLPVARLDGGWTVTHHRCDDPLP
jgi:hypothetical protein